MDSKLPFVIAIAAVLVVAGAAGIMLLGDKSQDDGSNDLVISNPGTYNGGTYDSVTISSSVGDGNVILKGMKILGNLIIKGGGSHSVELDGCEIQGEATVSKEGGEPPRIVAVNTTVGTVTATSDVILESDSAGSFKNVTGQGVNVTVQGQNTTVSNISLSGEAGLNVQYGNVDRVEVAKGATVDLTINNGNIDAVTVSDDVTLKTSDDQTAGQLDSIDIQMADGATGSTVTVNDTSLHVHKYEFTSINWTTLAQDTAGSYMVIATYTCPNCAQGETGHTESKNLAVSVERTEPTCTEDGRIHYYVPNTGDNGYNETINRLGHDYAVEFIWADDNSSASYVATCSHDRTHTEQGTVNSQVQTTPATCTADGSAVYSVSVTLSDGVHSDQKTVVLSKGHHYHVESADILSIPENPAPGAATIEATLVCSECDAQTEGHSISGTFSIKDDGEFVEPNCGQGTAGYMTVTVLYEGAEYPYTENFSAEHYYMTDVQAGVGDREHPHITITCIMCQNTVTIEDAVPHISDRVEPTCTQYGSYKYYAEGTYGGNTYRTFEETVLLDPLGHVYQFDWQWGQGNTTAMLIVTCAHEGCQLHEEITARVDVQTTASCTQAGDTVYTATAPFLNETKTDSRSVSGEALGHDYHITDVNWQTLDKEHMTVTVTKECSRCQDGDVGHTANEAVAVSVQVTVPTCIYEGYEHYYLESPQENGYNAIIPALGHDYRYAFEWSQDFSSAILHETCARGGCDYSHDYQASVNLQTIPSTCAVAGQTVYTATCTPADGLQHTDTKTVDLPLADHSYVVSEIHWNTLNAEIMIVEAVLVCSVCEESVQGHTVTQNVTVSVQTTPATCDEAGNNHYFVQGTDLDGYDVAIPAGSHQLVHHEGKAATCTEAGWEAYDTCSLCGHSTFSDIPALGHDLVHHDAQAPTVSEPGWEAYDTCSRCDYTTKVEIPPLHGYTVTVFGGLVAEKGDTPTNPSITVIENTVVTVTYTGSDFSHWTDNYGEYIPGTSFDILVTCDLYVTAHDVNDRVYGEWVHVSEPTCTEPGLWYRESGVFREYATFPALGHISDDNLVVDTPATCTAAGVGHTVCERCHENIVETIPAIGHDYVFTVDVAAHGSTVGRLIGECSACHDITYKNYISPIYPSGDIVVTFDWDHVRGEDLTDRDEVHTMWTFIDANDVQRQAYLYKVQLDVHKNGYISGVDNTSWFFWVDYGEHSPVYVARHNQSTPSYGGTTAASWSVAGYVDSLSEFIYLIDNLSIGVTIEGQDWHLGLGLDNGRDAAALFDLYDAWADVYNSGKAALYQSRSVTFRGWECTEYYNDDESFYVNADNCCLGWGRSNMVAGIEYGDMLQVVSISDEFTRPFTVGYNDYPQFAGYYFPNSMPSLGDTTYSCITIINGTYSSSDFIQSSSGRINYYNADYRGDAMTWISPNLSGHSRLVSIDVLNLEGVWVSVPFTTYVHNAVTYYGFDIGNPSISGLYTYLIAQYPGAFVMPTDPAFNGVFIRCVTEDIPPDSTVTVTGGTFSVEYGGEELTTASLYGHQYIYLNFEDVPGMRYEGIRETIDGNTLVLNDIYSYEVPENSVVTIEPIYSELQPDELVHINFSCTAGGSIDRQSGDYAKWNELEVTATVYRGYVFQGWYDITETQVLSESNCITNYPHLFYYPDYDADIKAVFAAPSLELFNDQYTAVYATDGFIHFEDVPVYVTALYANPEFDGRMYVHADPNMGTVHRWDILSYAEDPNSQVTRLFPADDWFDGDVKYCGRTTTVDAIFESEIQYYDLSYNLNGAPGSVVGGNYANDREVDILEAEWEGHNFLGWNTAQNGTGTGYNPGDVCTLEADLVLYAQWQVLSKDINLMGPSNAPYTFDMEKKNISVTWGETVNVPADVITVYGCALIGWDISIGGETQRIGVTGAIPYEIDSVIVRAVVGDFDEYRIHFVGGEVTPDNAMEDIVFNVSDIQNLKISWSSSANFKKAGYTLDGWTCDVDGDTPTKTSLSVSNRVKTEGYEHGGTFNLTAQWTKVTYVFDYKKGTAPAGVISGYGERVEFHCGESFTFTISPSKMYSLSGYTLAGFSTSTGNTVFLYEYGQTVDTDDLLADPNLSFVSSAYGMMEELYCVWAKNDYTVYFYPEQGSNDHFDQVFTYGSADNLAAVSTMGVAFQREGYTLLGWAAEGSDRIFTDGENVNNLTTTGSITLYAVWMHDTYTVHFDKNAEDATGEMADQSFNANESKALTLNGFSREGFTFQRWCTVPYNQGDYYSNGQTVCNLTTDESITLYAIWAEA